MENEDELKDNMDDNNMVGKHALTLPQHTKTPHHKRLRQLPTTDTTGNSNQQVPQQLPAGPSPPMDSYN
jgi:hypothetical protein